MDAIELIEKMSPIAREIRTRVPDLQERLPNLFLFLGKKVTRVFNIYLQQSSAKGRIEVSSTTNTDFAHFGKPEIHYVMSCGLPFFYEFRDRICTTIPNIGYLHIVDCEYALLDDKDREALKKQWEDTNDAEEALNRIKQAMTNGLVFMAEVIDDEYSRGLFITQYGKLDDKFVYMDKWVNKNERKDSISKDSSFGFIMKDDAGFRYIGRKQKGEKDE